MNRFFKVLKAEILKQHRSYFHNKTIYISLFLWPLLTFVSAYYGYKPFQVDKISKSVSYINENNLIVFMLAGYMCLIFFRTLVQSAWRFSSERIYGTLELVYLSPANRLAFILGNAISSSFESVWLFIMFGGAILMLKRQYFDINLSAFISGLMLMILLSVLWGMFLNSLFLFSRDSGFLYTILEEPMEVFAGIKVPSQVFPLWARVISSIFPLTYSAEVLRRALLGGESIYRLKSYFIIGILWAVLMLLVTVICLYEGEKHSKETGNMSLF